MEPTQINAALTARQVRMHRANTTLSIVGALVAAAALITMLSSAVPARALGGWLLCLLFALVLRGWCGRSRPSRVAGEAQDGAWLRRLRASFLCHGLAWAMTMALPIAPGDDLHWAILTIVLMGVVAGSFSATAFDLVSALYFGVPVLGGLSLRLLTLQQPTYAVLGLAFLFALGFLGVGTRRTQLIVRESEALRLSASAQARALRSSEELLERTGATAGVGGWELDAATLAVRLTAQSYRIHGVAPTSNPTVDTLVGLLGAEQREALRAGLLQALASGAAYDQTWCVTTPQGRQSWVRWIGQPQFDAARVVRLNGVVQDVTDATVAQHALAEQHHLLSLLVRTASEGFWFVDLNALTTDANPAMCEILGCTRDALIGTSVYDFTDARNAQIFRAQLERRLHGLASGYEITLRRRDGTEVACYNNATPIFDSGGRHTGSVGMWTDISERKRAEQALRDAGAQLSEKTQALEVTLNSINQGIVSTDAHGRVSVHNRRMRELLALPDALFVPGVTLQALVRYQFERGDPFDVHDAVPGATPAELLALPKSGVLDLSSLPDFYVRKTTTGMHLEVRTLRLPDGGVVRTYTDVTAYFEAQRKLRESEAELRSLLDAFPAAIAVLDEQLRYSYVNDRAARLLGRTRQSLIGVAVEDILTPERFATLRAYLQQAGRGEPVTEEVEFPATAERPSTWMQVTHAVKADAGLGWMGCYAIGIDIGARKRAEEALIAAKDEAERANRAKSQFLSNMSHELRTPLNAILGFAQLLGSDAAPALSARQRGHVLEIVQGGSHLLTLINEVLDLATVEAGKLRVVAEPVRIRALVQECVDMMHPLARAHGIEVRICGDAPEDLSVVADPVRLRQVLLNLLSNAIKYNRRGGHVAVQLASEAGSVRVAVTDSGPGLDAQQRARLFQAFERLEAHRFAVEGAGLGLALSRQLVEAMGGQIGLTSEVGRGSTFWISLPRARPPAHTPRSQPAAAPTPAAPPHPGRRRKVLYIEDNPVNVLLVQAMLARLPDVDVAVAALPEIGLEMALQDPPDVILLDIQLPGIDGYEVLRRLRAQPWGRRIPVIAVSANAMASDIEQGLKAGFAQYITKPVDMPQLLHAVQAACGSV